MRDFGYSTLCEVKFDRCQLSFAKWARVQLPGGPSSALLTAPINKSAGNGL